MKKIHKIITVVSLAVSGVLAFYMFWQRFTLLHLGLQYDELYSMATAFPGFSWGYIWREMLLKDVNLPLFNFILYGWNHIFPLTADYMHLLSALVSAATIPLGWFLAPKRWDLTQRFIFTALMAGSFALVQFAGIIRAYSFAVLAVSALTLQALSILDVLSAHKNPSAKRWSAFFFTGLCAAYLHYFSSALFFITALIVFIYACYLKTGRKTVFLGTAVVFACWLPWVYHTVRLMSAPGSSWWYTTPPVQASFEIAQFLFGSNLILGGLIVLIVVAGTSILFTYKKTLLFRTDLILPLGQTLILLGVITLVSHKYNLWMDRYFLAALPSFLLLLSYALFHLQERHRILIILLPLLLTGWVGEHWEFVHNARQEPTGLKNALAYLTQTEKRHTILVDTAKTGYPPAALNLMYTFYAPKDYPLTIIPLTEQNRELAFTGEKLPVLIPVCSVQHLIFTETTYGLEEAQEPLIFAPDICVLSAKEGKIIQDD